MTIITVVNVVIPIYRRLHVVFHRWVLSAKTCGCPSDAFVQILYRFFVQFDDDLLMRFRPTALQKIYIYTALDDVNSEYSS